MSSYKNSMNETQTNKLFKALDDYTDECDQLFNNPFIGIMKDVNVLVASNTVNDLVTETYYVVKRQGEVVDSEGKYIVKDPKKRKTLMLYCYKHLKKAIYIGDEETQYETISYTQARRMRSQPLEDRLNQLGQKSLDTFKHQWEIKCDSFIQ